MNEHYTKVRDDLIAEFGVYAALVFGRVERYCHMERNECSAKHETIAKSLGIGKSTVREKLKLLVDNGYLSCKKRGKIAVYTINKSIPIELSTNAIEESIELSPVSIAPANSADTPLIAPADSAHRASSQRVEETLRRDIYQETENNNIRVDDVEQTTQSKIPKYEPETVTPLAQELIDLGMWRNIAVDCVNICEPDEVWLGITEYEKGMKNGDIDGVPWLASALKLRKFVRADYSACA